MCLSTVYKNAMTDENVAMKNVMHIECRDGSVILTIRTLSFEMSGKED